MTRFARAEGSKASNKKAPEEATPWTLLKGKLKHNVNEAHSSDSSSQERCGNSVEIVYSDRSNSWSVEDQQPSTSSTPRSNQGAGNRPEEMAELDDPRLINAGGRLDAVERMVQELQSVNDISGPQLLVYLRDRRPTGKWTGNRLTPKDREILEKLKFQLIDEDVDVADIIDRLEAKSKELVKKGVKKCFKCRTNGHTYKDCPEKDESEVCFTCGSTEHSFKQCKKRKRNGSNFAFATCFICKEQGHLSSACPDNPTGLYPYGGGCHECGEVTHFSKECPQKQKKSAKKQMTVDILLDDDIEGLPEDKPIVRPLRPSKKTKIVNF